MVVKIPVGKSKNNKTIGKKGGIIIDVTTEVMRCGNIPSGIPRVGGFILRQAINDPDPLVSFAYLDRSARIFKSLTLQEVVNLEAAQADLGKTNNWLQVWSAAFRQIRKNPILGKDFERNTASRIVQAYGAERRGERFPATNVKGRADYKFYKNTLRLYRYFTRLVDFVSRKSNTKITLTGKMAGTLLFSHKALSESMFPQYMNATNYRAFVFHDNIPLDHPEYLSKPEIADEITPIIRKLRKSGALALCNSKYTEDSLRAFDRKIKTTDQPIKTFPMPSTLFFQTAKTQQTARISGAKPFILYCSTIEVRKNHILLAQIWKEALQSGNSLPPLYCVGKWGWGVEKLSEFMDASPSLGEHVVFLGQVSDEKLVELYRSALFSVYPSYLEGWGLGVSESLDFGLPAIISTATALQEASRGLMPAIDPDDKQAWSRQIRLLAEDGDALTKLRQKISDEYKPVSEEESWAEIKAAVCDR